MSTIANFEQWFDDRVRDAAGRITSLQRQTAIQDALKQYAAVRPVEVVTDYPGDGTTFDLALPAGWVTDFSIVRRIEYPAGRREPVFLEREDWGFYRTPSALKLRLYTVTPATGQTLRLTWTKPHVVDYVGSTVPLTDEDAVADLAASIGLRTLAAVFAGTVDPTIAADSVDYRSKSKEYSDLAREYEKRYRVKLGLDQTSEAKPAGGFVDVDQGGPFGMDKLTHPNRTR